MFALVLFILTFHHNGSVKYLSAQQNIELKFTDPFPPSHRNIYVELLCVAEIVIMKCLFEPVRGCRIAVRICTFIQNKLQ